MSTTKLTADDISCGACANSIKNALGRLDGVIDVQVDVPTKTVTVEHDEQRATRQAVVETLDKAGFPAS
jgi:copper chaperone CopZ